MTATQRSKVRPGAWTMLAMPLLALAAIYYKSCHDEFPYRGTWSAANQQPEGVFRAVLGFDGASCSMTLIGPCGPDDVLRYGCSYKMQGRSAVVTAALPDAQVINGRWRFVLAPQPGAATPDGDAAELQPRDALAPGPGAVG